MITFESNQGRLVESVDELPELGGENIYLDLETTSGDPKIRSVNPWHNCWVAGICIKVDNSPAYYVPVGHHRGNNLPNDQVQRWLVHVLDKCKRWVNHNIKYDVQVLYRAFGIDTSDMELQCTLDLAKLVDSDRMSYSLTNLSHDWLHERVDQYEAAFKPYLEKSKDYGAVPIDLMAEYGCQDVISVARLWNYLKANIPEGSRGVAETSSRCTSVLVDMERQGLRINPAKVAVEELLALQRMLDIQEELESMVGFPVEPHVNKDCYEVLCNYYGFPVLSTNESGNPSFDKFALVAYQAQHNAPEKAIQLIKEYRKHKTFTTLTCAPFRTLHNDGLLHSSYNQTVRTGRMSCKMPNAQQMDKRAKSMIICNEDEVLLAADYSQIEFRLIAHILNNPGAIEAYAKDAFTDYHTWVAELCQIPRRPAKNVNFLLAYGGGKNRLISELMKVPELVSDLQASSKDADDFQRQARTRALDVYDTYHMMLPELRQSTARAGSRIRDVGYVTNFYGRRRHLPLQASFRAFNSWVQGTAADLMKAQMVKLYDFLNTTNFRLVATVHDSVLIRGPKEELNNKLLQDICIQLEDVQQDKLRIPIRASIGAAYTNWTDADANSENLDFIRTF